MHVVWRLTVSSHSPKDTKAAQRKEQNFRRLINDISGIWNSAQSQEISHRDKLNLESRKLKEELIYPADPYNEVQV